MTEPSPPLDYARADGARRWRRPWIRRTVALAVVVVFATLLYTWGPGAWRHATLLYWQRQCMGYIAPVDALLYQPRSSWWPTRHVGDPDFVNDPGPSGGVVFSPECLRQFRSRIPRTLSLNLVAGIPRTPATIFLHGMTTPSGERRLVVVEGSPDATVYIPAFDFDYQIYTPAGMRSSARRVDRQFSKQYSGRNVEVRVLVGRPDPADPTHFTIGYRFNGRGGTIDAWLRDDETIRFKTRDGAALKYSRP